MLQQLWEGSGEVLHHNSNLIGVSIGIVLLAALIYFIRRTPTVTVIPSGEAEVKKHEYEAAARKRRTEENQRVEEMITDGLLDLLIKGKLSETGYYNWQKRMAAAFKMPDLKPSELTRAETKEILKKRRNGGTYYGRYARVNIPGPKPGERVAKNALEEAMLSKLQS